MVVTAADEQQDMKAVTDLEQQCKCFLNRLSIASVHLFYHTIEQNL